VSVYRVEHAHRTRVVADQYIVITDLGGFSLLCESSPMAVVEAVLDRLSELVAAMCREFGGLARFSRGDGYCLTFSEPTSALAAAERLTREWAAYTVGAGLRCPMTVGVHKGVLHLFRSYLYGADLNAAARIEGLAGRVADGESAIFVSDRVRKDLASTVWETRL
jgi:class 3 adenylate cyclase